MEEMRTFPVESFGAAGDGKTDDGPALAAAVAAAAAAGEAARVTLRAGATYYVASVPEVPGACAAAFMLVGLRNLRIEGDGTTILLKPPLMGFHAAGCEQVTLRGLRFQYAPKVCCRAQVLAIHHEEVSVTVRTPFPLPMEGDTYDAYRLNPGCFAMPLFNFREHLFLTQFRRLPEPNTYRLYVQQDHSNRRVLRLLEDKGLDLVVPTPGITHHGVTFHILGCSDFHMEDCDVFAAPQFVFAIKGNLGPLYFDRVRLQCDPHGDDPVAGWRDGYHCKDNRGPIHWRGCVVRDLYDDTFNISCTYLKITRQYSATEIDMASTENGGCYYGLQAGDEVSIYDTYAGIFHRRTRIRAVVEQHGATNRVILEDPLPPEWDQEHTVVAVDSLCAPGSTIEDCEIAGTVRFRGPLTVRNTTFRLLVLWLENECTIEGPIPRDIVFEHCRFEGEYPVEERYLKKYISIKTCQQTPGRPAYGCERIAFRDCRLDRACLYIEEGNDVTID